MTVLGLLLCELQSPRTTISSTSYLAGSFTPDKIGALQFCSSTRSSESAATEEHRRNSGSFGFTPLFSETRYVTWEKYAHCCLASLE